MEIQISSRILGRYNLYTIIDIPSDDPKILTEGFKTWLKEEMQTALDRQAKNVMREILSLEK